ncbi:MAG: hypothetical protein JWP86_3286, partial [Phenylobacterium sp.]|nr:hypothetical protein [Phenylobacterium sp.]
MGAAAWVPRIAGGDRRMTGRWDVKPGHRSRLAWAALSVAAHVGVLAALLAVGPEPLRL